MKVTVSNYSYYRSIKNGSITPFECIAKSKELGLDAIEFVDFVDFPLDKRESWKEIAESYKKECERVGIEISCLTVGADLLQNPEQDIQKIKDYIDVGEILGVKFMRHDATVGYPRDSDKYCSFDSIVDDLADKFRELTEYAESKGIRTMTENHGYYSQDSERVEKLYTKINHSNFGLLCDVGNFMCADENPAVAVSRVAPYAIYVHCKDFIKKSFYSEDPGEGSFKTRAGDYLIGTIIGHGNVPVKQCLAELKACGYDGYIAVEFEGMEDPFDGVRIGRDNIVKYWNQI
ncbi:MAG: sugar phosphate isomerase/epimerase [Clostridia bacterium]|nr:sugar phosphate isomerase/epimerase [Clostridia bacterium]